MTAPRPYESDLLDAAESVVREFSEEYGRQAFEGRLQFLEAAASRFGGFALDAFQAKFQIRPITPVGNLVNRADALVQAIESSGIHPSLALSALAREPLDVASRRTTGAYHTDFRLAKTLAKQVCSTGQVNGKIIDPACGAGMLLCALTIEMCGGDRKKISRWLTEKVHAVDRSGAALRGALLALGSLTNDLSALSAMRSKWLVGDSLFISRSAWNALAPGGFQVVIGNPPWEKVKLSRHEYLRSQGELRHYGAEFNGIDQKRFEREKNEFTDYAKRLLERYPFLAAGEPDLYIAFTSLFEELCARGGIIAAVLPAGLIRSQGTTKVRQHLLTISDKFSVAILENRAKFFSIDSRFKFLLLTCTKATENSVRRHPILLTHATGTTQGVKQVARAVISRNTLNEIRRDGTIPEVRSTDEWRIFRHMARTGVLANDSHESWRIEFCREVDMTRERLQFKSTCERGDLPVVEGRMVQQHRFGAKGYVSGSGRRATWEDYPFGASRVNPQFFIASEKLPVAARARSAVLRAGFCDITGQTNERSMMAALVPPGVVCGNKVPTVLFPADTSEDRLYVWAAIVNSIPFDWALRRIITTTVNYFLLLSVPLPRITKDGLPWRRLCSCAKELRGLDGAAPSLDRLRHAAQLRADIDAEVAMAYGLACNELEIMMNDFPLLDRNQPALHGERRSTVTRDLMLYTAAKRMGASVTYWEKRVESALAIGACAYVPSDFAVFGTRDTLAA